MNNELRSVLLFMRTDLVRIERKIHGSQDGLQIEADNMFRNDMVGLIHGVVNTLDDIIQTGAVMWNALYLLHLIQSLTIHMSNIGECQTLSDRAGCILFVLHIDYKRVQCHLETILYMCRTNLSSLCNSQL
jgi:hypothetical protein